VPENPAPDRSLPEKKPFLLRLTPALYERVRALAAREMRSVNAQIEFLLAEAVRRRTAPGPPARSSEGEPGEEEEGPPARGRGRGEPPATPGGRGSSRG
jgi:hypothetical protein